MNRNNLIILGAAALIVAFGAIYYLGYTGEDTVAPETSAPVTTN